MKIKKNYWDNFDDEHYEKAKESKVKTTTITFRCTQQEKLDFMEKVSNPSELLRDFINQYKK